MNTPTNPKPRPFDGPVSLFQGLRVTKRKAQAVSVIGSEVYITTGSRIDRKLSRNERRRFAKMCMANTKLTGAGNQGDKL